MPDPKNKCVNGAAPAQTSALLCEFPDPSGGGGAGDGRQADPCNVHHIEKGSVRKEIETVQTSQTGASNASGNLLEDEKGSGEEGVDDIAVTDTSYFDTFNRIRNAAPACGWADVRRCSFSSGHCREGTPATHHCAACAEFLCLECFQLHSKGRATRTHSARPLSKQEGGSREVQPSVDTCHRHPGRPFEMWCETHGCPICLNCIVAEHKSCDFDFFEQMLGRHQPGMTAALSELKTRQRTVEQAIIKLLEVETQLTLRRDVLAAEIGQRCDALAAVLTQRKAELIEAVGHASAAKKGRLLAQREALQDALASMKAGCSLADRTLQQSVTAPDQVLLVRQP